MADRIAGAGKLITVVLLPLALAGCMGDNTGVAVETKIEQVPVAVRAPCPDPDTRNKVNAARPVPLRQQTKPATEDAIRAAEHQQLFLYEGPGQWADQAQAVMDRCFTAAPLPTDDSGLPGHT